MHIGRNITQYDWDGKDEYGDQLANGLYLYRVITDIRGESIEKRATEADKYFKKGWGKMYLMRYQQIKLIKKPELIDSGFFCYLYKH